MKRWIRFRMSLAQRTSIHFNEFLARNSYEGHIQFDHKQGKLDIKVKDC